MRLTELLREDLIKLGLKADNKWEAIQELIELLVSVKALNPRDRDEAASAVFARERSLSTGLEYGVAVPHAVTGCVDKTAGALGTSAGIDFESADGQDAKLIILLLIPQGTLQRHVRTLAGIAKLGASALLRERVFAAQDPRQIMDVLRQADKTCKSG